MRRYTLAERLFLLDHLEETVGRSWRAFCETFPKAAETTTYFAHRARIRRLRKALGIVALDSGIEDAVLQPERITEREALIERLQAREDLRRKKLAAERRRKNHENETRRML